MPSPAELRDSRYRSGGRDRDRDRSRVRGRGRGSFVDYYSDLGIGTTSDIHKQWKKGESTFAKAVKENQGKIASFESEYNKAKAKGVGKVPSYKSLYDDAWSNFKKDTKFIPVRVVDGNNIEATYNLPMEAAKKLQSGLDPYYHTNLQSGWMNIDVDAKGGGGKRGQEVHDAVRGAEAAYISGFKKSADPQIKSAISSAKKTVAANQAVLDEALANLNTSKNQLSSSIDSHDSQNKKYKTEYQNRLGRITSAITGTNFIPIEEEGPKEKEPQVLASGSKKNLEQIEEEKARTASMLEGMRETEGKRQSAMNAVWRKEMEANRPVQVDRKVDTQVEGVDGDRV